MLVLCPVIAGLSIYISAVYGFTYLLFSTFSAVFEDQYHYTGEHLGRIYLGLAGGMLILLSFASVVNDRLYRRLSNKYREEKPE
jgi:hypothetical protein